MEVPLYDVASGPSVVDQPSRRGTPCRGCESVNVGGPGCDSDRDVCHGSGRVNGVKLAGTDCDFCCVDCGVDGNVPGYAVAAGRVRQKFGLPESAGMKLLRLLVARPTVLSGKIVQLIVGSIVV